MMSQLLKGDRICRDCHRKRGAVWAKNNRDKVRFKNRKRYHSVTRYKMYGVSPDWYDKKFLEQNKCCAICKRTESANKRTFAIDHCHKTGIVRGLLCIRCNAGLGQFLDNEENIINALQYIRRYKHEEKA